MPTLGPLALAIVLIGASLVAPRPAPASAGGASPQSVRPSSVAASQRFGVSDQTDAYLIDNDGALSLSWVVGTGAWQGPARISATSFAPPGAGVAASQRFGQLNQTDVYVVDSTGALTVSSVVGGGAGTWTGPTRISPAGYAPAGAPLTASARFGLTFQTDVYLVDSTGALTVWSVVGGGAGTWTGPTRISPAGYAPPGAAVAASRHFGAVENQTDVYVVSHTGTLTGYFTFSGSPWIGPVTISAPGFAPPGAAITTTRQNGPPGPFGGAFVALLVVDHAGAVNVAAARDSYYWNPPLRISATGFAPAGAAGAASPRFGQPSQFDAYFIGNAGMLAVFSNVPARWNGPSWAGALIARPGTALAVSQRFGVAQTDVFGVDTGGALAVGSLAGGVWQGPTRITPPGHAP